MRHITHIYIVKKAIDFMINSLNDLRYCDGKVVDVEIKNQIKDQCEGLKELLKQYQDSIVEATWAPNFILNDRGWYHNFKLFTSNEFYDAENYAKETHIKGGIKYFRVAGGGGLPYKVDHLARFISDLKKLRTYNENDGAEENYLSMKLMIYLLFLLSHYIVDAHVPMHCDMRSDKPTNKSPLKGKYYDSRWHHNLESLWDRACTVVSIKEGIVDENMVQNGIAKSNYTEYVTFNNNDNNEINACLIPESSLMDYMIDLCILSKKRSLELFPIGDPNNIDWNKFPGITRKIFADSISNLISVWISVWFNNKEKIERLREINIALL